MLQVKPFNLKKVRLLNSVFYENMQRFSVYLGQAAWQVVLCLSDYLQTSAIYQD
jgi:hypothetical protein